MGQYYRRHDFAPRYALFVCAALISGAVSSFLAYAIDFMDGTQGLSAWRWIFILEGLGSIAVSIVSYFVVPGFPAEAKFLTLEEKEFLLQKLENDKGKESISMKNLNWFKVLTNWKVWMA